MYLKRGIIFLVFSKNNPIGSFFHTFWKREDKRMSLRSMRTRARILVSNETKITLTGHFYFLAEARGFEPPRHCCPHDFESCAFNHSATLPLLILSHPTSKDKHTHQLILQKSSTRITKKSMKSAIISIVIQ